jgi:hypothetical protein
MFRTIVRVQISRDRAAETRRELEEFASKTTRKSPYIQGTSGDLIWEWSGLGQAEDARFFVIGIRDTPGVLKVSEPERIRF